MKIAETERIVAFAPIRRRVYDYICQTPGQTDRQIQRALNLNVNTARPRRIELEEAGLVSWAGIFVGDEGACALTWQATELPYPAKWQPVNSPETTASGEARIRRALNRAFKSPSATCAALIERLPEGLIKSGQFDERALEELLRAMSIDDLRGILAFLVT